MKRNPGPPVSAGILVLVLLIGATERPNLSQLEGTASSPGAGIALSPAQPIRVLILSGQNNHDWKSTTPKLKATLETGGRFVVDIVEDPARLTSRSLEICVVILSNWNAFGLDPSVSGWPSEARTAYIEFVRRGGGHVVVHAGGASFPGWEDYGRIALATWKNGQTSHGPRHEFPVRIENSDHPVTAGLKPFTIFDELWNRPGIAAGAEVLASSYSAPDKQGTGRWEPAVLAGRFGEGRSVAILLGHDAEAMDNLSFQELLRRSVEWAATGRVTAAWETGIRARRWDATRLQEEYEQFSRKALESP